MLCGFSDLFRAGAFFCNQGVEKAIYFNLLKVQCDSIRDALTFLSVSQHGGSIETGLKVVGAIFGRHTVQAVYKHVKLAPPRGRDVHEYPLIE